HAGECQRPETGVDPTDGCRLERLGDSDGGLPLMHEPPSRTGHDGSLVPMRIVESVQRMARMLSPRVVVLARVQVVTAGGTFVRAPGGVRTDDELRTVPVADDEQDAHTWFVVPGRSVPVPRVPAVHTV